MSLLGQAALRSWTLAACFFSMRFLRRITGIPHTHKQSTHTQTPQTSRKHKTQTTQTQQTRKTYTQTHRHPRQQRPHNRHRREFYEYRDSISRKRSITPPLIATRIVTRFFSIAFSHNFFLLISRFLLQYEPKEPPKSGVSFAHPPPESEQQEHLEVARFFFYNQSLHKRKETNPKPRKLTKRTNTISAFRPPLCLFVLFVRGKGFFFFPFVPLHPHRLPQRKTIIKSDTYWKKSLPARLYHLRPFESLRSTIFTIASGDYGLVFFFLHGV